jgi:tagatose 1,6-diphosphate aldolase
LIAIIGSFIRRIYFDRDKLMLRSMRHITQGKLNGLENISNKAGFFIIAALDHRNSLKRMISPMEAENVPSSIVQTIKTEFTKSLAPNVSAVLLDPEYGLNASDKKYRKAAGLIMSLEESGFVERGERRYTELLADWNVKKSKEAKADAVKVLLYYRPDDESSEAQLNLVKRVGKMCKDFDMLFICEPFVYSLKGEADFGSNLPHFVVETAEELSEYVDVLKLQFPGDVKTQSLADLRKNCDELDAACKVPWVLLSGGIRYDEFLKQVEIASRSNASGIMVGRALWQEAFEKKSLSEIVNFVNTESVARLKKLSIIVRNGMPWFDRN